MLDSVEKGLHKLISYSLMDNKFSRKNLSDNFMEKNIHNLISSKLPLITIEQLKIKENFNNVEHEINLDNKKDFYSFQENFEYLGDLISNKIPKFQTNKNITNSFNYYGDENSEKILSLDLDRSDNFNYLSFQNFDNLVFEKELKLSLIELIEQENVDKLRNSSNFINNENDNFIKNISIFDSIDDSLENLLLEISNKINLQFHNSNLIKNLIKEDAPSIYLAKMFL